MTNQLPATNQFVAAHLVTVERWVLLKQQCLTRTEAARAGSHWGLSALPMLDASQKTGLIEHHDSTHREASL